MLVAHVARWRSGKGVGLATGDRGFNHSRYTVECDFAQVVRTHCPAPLKLRLYGAINQFNLKKHFLSAAD